SAANQVVEVLGTQFNINAYSDEEVIRTTLLEGSVLVKATFSDEQTQKPIEIKKKLVPHQQSLVPGVKMAGKGAFTADISVKPADVGQAISWKNNLFNFQHAGLESVMRQLARWYDIEVVYENGV